MIALTQLLPSGGALCDRLALHKTSGFGHTSPALLEIIDPLEIAPGVFWVGKRDPDSLFHSNPYLRVFRGEQGEPELSILVDPGSAADVAIVCNKVTRVLGDMSRLSAVFINHQDPDVGSSAPRILGRHAPSALVLCSEDTWRIIVHGGLPKERYVPTDSYDVMQLATGHKIKPVPTPFCHFRGAVMLYDFESKVLFSGDLFGGLTEPGLADIWATEADWKGIRAFHQLYMPTNAALRRAVAAIRKLEVDVIAPQHGRIIQGPLVEEFMGRLEELPVGLDVLDEDTRDLDGWNTVLSRVLEVASMLLGDPAIAALEQHRHLHDTMRFGAQPAAVSLGRWTVGQVVAALTHGQPASLSNTVKLEALAAAEDLGLPTPDITLAQESRQAPRGLFS